MIKVAIVDDHSVVRIGIKYVLKTEPRLAFVGEASTGEEALPLVERVKPDILLLDVRMPGMDGLAVLKEVLARYPEQKIVMLTTSLAEEDVYQSLKLGAKGYVVKDNAPAKIVEAILTVAEGGRYIEEVAQTAYEVRSGERGLSPRELDVLKFVSKGCANTEIAELLGVSHNTVKNHLKAIFEKMGAADRAEAVALALRRGVIS